MADAARNSSSSLRERHARVAGLLYLLAIVVGWLTLAYLPDRFIVSGDAIATARNIAGNESLFRVTIFGDLFCGSVWLFVVLALYRLLSSVDRIQSALMVILGAFMQVPLYFVNAVNYAAALVLVAKTNYLSTFSDAQRDAMAMLFLKMHHYEILASLLFAGLWLFPFGILVFRSGFLPRTLGIWLVLNGFAWVAVCVSGFLTPQYSGIVSTITAPMNLGEIVIALWLSVIGARTLGRARDGLST